MRDVLLNNPYGRLSTLSTESVLRDGRATLQNSYFTAPLKLLPPHNFGGTGALLVTQLNVSAGVMAGDRQEIRLRVGEGTKIVWTSQSYEKIHRMKPGTWAQRSITADIDPGALLFYRPLPVIPFADSDFRGLTRINMADESSRLIYADIFCGGRIARGELFQFRRYRQVMELRLGGLLFYRDNTDLQPDANYPNKLSGIGLFEGYTHSASLVLCNTGCTIDQIRKWLEEGASPGTAAAATALNGGKGLLLKALGKSADELEKLLLKITERASGQW
ncbi:MAG: urease accessory protein UreD [Termitinemataceae bacterium]|nr:MAG: urease accessory protein UreD [Termitinemataceae bacterium]